MSMPQSHRNKLSGKVLSQKHTIPYVTTKIILSNPTKKVWLLSNRSTIVFHAKPDCDIMTTSCGQNHYLTLLLYCALTQNTKLLHASHAAIHTITVTIQANFTRSLITKKKRNYPVKFGVIYGSWMCDETDLVICCSVIDFETFDCSLWPHNFSNDFVENKSVFTDCEVSM